MKKIKDIIIKVFPVRIKLLQNFIILKNDFAQYRSMKSGFPVNKSGEAIPWYTFPAIEYLSQFDFSNFEILEFGSGYSTVFWAKRCKKIISVEHRSEWLNIVKDFISDGTTELILQDENNYTQICNTADKKFDLIVIDGIRRPECAREIAKCLKPETGIVVLDNSDWYPETSKYLRNELNLFEIDFFGFGPINNYTWCTSVFISKNTNLKPLKNQPNNGIASLIQNCEND